MPPARTCWAAEGTVLPREEAVLGQDGLRVTLIGPDGGVLYDTDAAAAQMESHSNRPEVQQAQQTGEGSAVRRSSTLGQNTFYYAVRTESGSVLRAAKDAHGILLVFAKALPAALATGAVLIALGMVLSRRLSRSFVAPIERLAHDMDSAGEQQTAASYPELVPLMDTIRSQHEAIVKNADMRQEFTANVSHELKTPLAAISGYSELIASGMAKGEDAKRFSEEIHKSADRLLTLINDVIRLSGAGRAGREPHGGNGGAFGRGEGMRRPFGLFCRKARRCHCGAGRGCLCARGPARRGRAHLQPVRQCRPL